MVDFSALERLKALHSASDDEFHSQIDALETLFPGHVELWKARVHRLIRSKAFDDACQLIDGFPIDPADGDTLIAKAEFLHEAKKYERAGELYRDLLERFPHRPYFRISYAKRLNLEGRLVLANGALLPVKHVFLEGTKSHELQQKTADLLHLLCRLEGRQLREDEDARIIAMKHAILFFKDREPRKPSGEGLGRLTLITGSLGPGGAERQLTRLAIELEKARKARSAVGGVPLSSPVEIVVRSHGPEKQNDFYLADVQDEGVELSQMNQFVPVGTGDLEIQSDLLAELIDYLPPPVNFGVRRLTPHLRKSGTDTASMWQDGAVLIAGLSALIAGVPHIQIAIRGLPPSMRRHMFRPEYEELYRALAQVPGVSFLSNSLSAARAYAEWLDVPIDRFAIVYNGVQPMRPDPLPDCQAQWDAFAATTADADHTIGGVFRFDTDKQPLLWIRFAARYLKRHPKARIVLVGGGRLLPNAQDLANELGISDRILFVGRSTRVGFWMTKMDVLILTSRYEGLPNVLIEAQYMGVRVVTTPAGGAAECLIDGTTGYVLECPEKPNLEKMVQRVHSLVLRAGDRELFREGGPGRKFLDDHFSVPRMLEDYVACTAARLHGRERLAAEEERRVA